MSNSDRYYCDSGAVPLSGTAMMLVCGLLGSLVLALPYALAQRYISHDKLKAIVTIVFALLIGGVVSWASRKGAVRHRLFASGVGLFIGLLALFFSWMWFILILDDWNPRALVLDPVQMVQLVDHLAHAGMWVNHNNVPLGSTELFLHWGVEALLIVLAPAIAATKNRTPFCEDCGAWSKATAAGALPYADEARLKADLEDDQYETLLTLHARPNAPERRFGVTLHTCPQCSDFQVLTMTVDEITPKKDGEQIKSRPFLKGLYVPADVSDLLREQLGGAGRPAPGAPPAPSAPSESA